MDPGDSDLAMISLKGRKYRDALSIQPAYEASQFDEWFWFSFGSNHTKQDIIAEKCSFQANLTCSSPESKAVLGWPILVRKARHSFIVGLKTSENAQILINKKGFQWIGDTLAKSVGIQDMPSCRGPGKLKLLACFRFSAKSFFFLDKKVLRMLLKAIERKQLHSEPMQKDDNKMHIVIENLKRDLEGAKFVLQNQTRTIDRLLDRIESKDKAIQDLKQEASSRCDSKSLSLYISFFSTYK